MDKEDSANNKGKIILHCDPGWNDPPLYSYDSLSAAGQANPNKKVNILNKRVAYPMGQQQKITGGMNPTLPPSVTTVLPPPSSVPLSLEPDLLPSNDTKPQDKALLDKDLALNRVQEIFKEILEDNKAEMQQGLDEINRRLTTMYKMWEDDRFSSSIQQRLLELVEALKAKDLDRADHLHVGLAVDHPSPCASWIPGVRRIVQHLKSLKQLESQTDHYLSEPLPHLISSTNNEEMLGKEEAKV